MAYVESMGQFGALVSRTFVADAAAKKLGLHQGADDNRRVLAVLAFPRG
ncbi:MAG: hypothetical protein L0K86_24220 [Actinomycetia bacterium]|nr:hypothetical protein [Actinomycetes bacterium]